MEFKPLKSINNKGHITILPEGKYEYAIIPNNGGIIIKPTDDKYLKNALEEVAG